MFAFNPPEFLVKFVAGFGPVVVVSLLGALVTLAALFLLVPNADRLGLIDKPTHRKRHGTPTPMVGGLAIFLGLAASLSVATPLDDVFPFVIAASCFVVLGVIDDRLEINGPLRSCLQALIIIGYLIATSVRSQTWGWALRFPLIPD